MSELLVEIAGLLEGAVAGSGYISIFDINRLLKEKLPARRIAIIDVIRDSLYESFEVFVNEEWIPCIRSLRPPPVEFLPLTDSTCSIAPRPAVEHTLAAFSKELVTYLMLSPIPISSIHDLLASLELRPHELTQLLTSPRIAAFLDDAFLDSLAMKITIKLKSALPSPVPVPVQLQPAPQREAPPPAPPASRPAAKAAAPARAAPTLSRKRACAFDEAAAERPKPSRCQMEAARCETTHNWLQFAQSLQLACLCGGVVAEHEVREIVRAFTKVSRAAGQPAAPSSLGD